MHQWYALSDLWAEEVLYDTLSMRRFENIGGLDETTVLNFRHLMKRHDVKRKPFNHFDAHLLRKEQSLRGCMIVDAIITGTPNWTEHTQPVRS
nr:MULTISPECIES: hypothetical protein [Xanthomonas]